MHPGSPWNEARRTMPTVLLPILRRTRTGAGLLLAILAYTLAGCSTITVHRTRAPDALEAWQASFVESGGVSPRTLQSLRQWDLADIYRRSPAEAHAALQAVAARDPTPDRLFALAELSYILGQEAEKWEKPTAVVYYYLCAGYAYHYLFPGSRLPGEPRGRDDALRLAVGAELGGQGSGVSRDVANGSPPAGQWFLASCFDPRFRLACDLYNTGLSKCIRAAQRVGRLDPSRQLHLPTPDNKGFALSVDHRGFAWRSEEFGPLLFCADYEVDGLDNEFRGYGLGVPLIGTLVPTGPGPAHAFYPREDNFPVTAFFRFEGTVADLVARRSGRLELYNPLTEQFVEVNGLAVPLETNLTTPLAYYLSHTEFNDTPYEGFLHADKLQNRAGIYMFEPYQPGKIPVVMVHGLLSSPVTWAPMFNDLRADPVLRKRFQFWFYLYPTSNPYLLTAADLRQTLLDLRAELDPQHRDSALDQMVFVGHSMGGLISKLLTVDSSDDFWALVSSQRFDTLKLSPDTQNELARIFFFEHEPCIRRVIFIGTPHHGSKLSPSFPAKLADKFVHLPKQLLQAAADLAKANPKVRAELRQGSFPTSVDLLAPHAPALELLASRPEPQGVHFHSIIGVLPHPNYFMRALLPGGRSREGTDGVVPYNSAHLPGADSELVVPASHFYVHHHPLAILEVRRILVEHLRMVGGELVGGELGGKSTTQSPDGVQ
jgi:pimeloyl-ACP methyl ester carboxylesterase